MHKRAPLHQPAHVSASLVDTPQLTMDLHLAVVPAGDVELARVVAFVRAAFLTDGVAVDVPVYDDVQPYPEHPARLLAGLVVEYRKIPWLPRAVVRQAIEALSVPCLN